MCVGVCLLCFCTVYAYVKKNKKTTNTRNEVFAKSDPRCLTLTQMIHTTVFWCLKHHLDGWRETPVHCLTEDSLRRSVTDYPAVPFLCKLWTCCSGFVLILHLFGERRNRELLLVLLRRFWSKLGRGTGPQIHQRLRSGWQIWSSLAYVADIRPRWH